MKKIIILVIYIFVSVFVLPASSFAQGMMGNDSGANNIIVQNDDGHTAREEAEGKAVWEKLQAKELACKDLSDDNFETLGEYFMGQTTGASHIGMNNMMVAMMGEKAEEQMHAVMGKRLSGCDVSATFPSQGVGFMSMMNMMMGSWSSSSGINQGNNSMMNFGFMPFGGLGWIFMVLSWILIILGLITFIKWLMPQSRGSRNNIVSSHAKEDIDKK